MTRVHPRHRQKTAAKAAKAVGAHPASGKKAKTNTIKRRRPFSMTTFDSLASLGPPTDIVKKKVDKEDQDRNIRGGGQIEMGSPAAVGMQPNKKGKTTKKQRRNKVVPSLPMTEAMLALVPPKAKTAQKSSVSRKKIPLPMSGPHHKKKYPVRWHFVARQQQTNVF